MPKSSRPSTLQDEVYRRLEEDILNGIVAPGEPLRVLHLAGRFGTSQAPIREALHRLTEEGLAETVPYRGTVIRAPSWDEISDIYLLREELEAFAVRQMMGRADSDLREIRRALKSLHRAVKSGDSIRVLDADLELHRCVVTQASSALTLETWSSIIKRQRGARLSLEREYPADVASVSETHEALVDALASGDVTRAEKEARTHIQSALETFAQRRLRHIGRLD